MKIPCVICVSRELNDLMTMIIFSQVRARVSKHVYLEMTHLAFRVKILKSVIKINSVVWINIFLFEFVCVKQLERMQNNMIGSWNKWWCRSPNYMMLFRYSNWIIVTIVNIGFQFFQAHFLWNVNSINPVDECIIDIRYAYASNWKTV